MLHMIEKTTTNIQYPNAVAYLLVHSINGFCFLYVLFIIIQHGAVEAPNQLIMDLKSI